MTAVDPALARARELLVVRLNKGVNLLADRHDLIASVQWNAQPTEPPAWFTVDNNEVTLNGPIALAGAEPADINPLTPDGRRQHPVMVGLLCHEASHAHSTRWATGFGDHTPVVVARAAVLLEEPRVERRQLQRRPSDRLYLRAASQLILLPAAASASEAATRWQAAHASLLTGGRVDAGVLDATDVRKILALCRRTLGHKDFKRLRDLWRDALKLDDGDVAGLVEVAAEWVEVVGVDDPADAPAPACARGLPDTIPTGEGRTDQPDDSRGSGDDADDNAETETSADPDGGESIGEAAAGSDKLAEALVAAFRDAMDAVGALGSAQAAAELHDEDDQGPAGTSGPDGARPHDTREQQAAEQEAAEQEADRVFHGYTPTGGANPRGLARPPTPVERQLARRTGKALRRAQFRERGRIVTASAVPPGRLMGREAMLGAAQRVRKLPVTAKPFRRVVHRDSPEPPLTVGIAVDISASMSWATEVMASTAWVVAHAVADIGGTSATVAFGERVTAITTPGVPPARVQSFVAKDGYEMFTDAMRALDGALRLTGGTGARLVFVVSDGRFGAPGEKERTDGIVDRFTRCGVIVLWLNLQSRARRRPTIVPAGALSVPVVDASDIPRQVGTILVRALRAH